MSWSFSIFGKNIVEFRSSEIPMGSLTNPNPEFSLLGMASNSGVRVTEESAMGYQPVFACVRVLSEALAIMPFKPFVKNGKNKSIAYNLPSYTLMTRQPNASMNPAEFKELMLATVLLRGNAYAYIKRQGTRPVELVYYHPNEVTVLVNETTKELEYQINGFSSSVKSIDMIHIKGLGNEYVGKSIIAWQMETLGLGMAAVESTGDFFNNNGQVPGFISAEGNLTSDQRKANREEWKKTHSGKGNRHKVAVLGGGMSYHKIGISPNEGQFLESRKHSATEIAGLFKVPPFMIGAGELKFKSIGELNVWFLTHGLLPWVTKFEEEFNRKLFTIEQKNSGNYFTKFNHNVVLRTDVDSRRQWYESMQKNGVFSIDDVRELEDLNPLPNEEGADHLVQANNMLPVNKLNEYIDAKIKVLTTKTTTNEPAE